jgi:hypothetical protein
MLVSQMLVALFLGVGDLGIPTTFLHYSLGSEDGFLKAIMTVDTGGIFYQVAVFDVPPPITITDTRNVPGGVVDCTGYKLAEFYGFWHDGLLSTQKRRPILVTGRPECWNIGCWVTEG